MVLPKYPWLRSSPMNGIPAIPQALLDRTPDPAFWEEYFMWDAREEYPHEVEATCRFDVGPGYALVLDAYVSSRVYGLSLEANGRQTEIATDDDAHPVPDALRWEEVDLVGRCLALSNPALPHPGIAVLLLCRFAPICVGDDLPEILSLLDAAWKTVPAMDPRDITRHIERLDSRAAGLRWRATEVDWVLEATDDEPYSFRVEGNADFPFEAMRSLREAAGKTLSRSRTLPAVIPLSERRIRPRLSLLLRIPHVPRPSDRIVMLPDTDVEMVVPTYGAAWRELDAALKEAGAGTASPGGATYNPDLGLRETHWEIELRVDLEVGVAVIQAAAPRIDLPKGSKLQLAGPHPRWEIEL